MKALIIDNTIVSRFNSIPKWVPQFMNVHGLDLLTPEELEAKGILFVDEIEPEYDWRFEHVSNTRYDPVQKKVVRDVIPRTDLPPIEDVKAEKIKELKQLVNSRLSETDWYFIRKIDRGINIPAEIIEQRAAILIGSEKIEDEINSLGTLKEVFNYQIEI